MNHLPDRLAELYADVGIDILRDMVRRISEFDGFMPPAQWRYKNCRKQDETGYTVERFSQIDGEIRQRVMALLIEVEKTLGFDDEIYRVAGVVEVSAHAGACVGNGCESPSKHAWWQGKVYRRAGNGRPQSKKLPFLRNLTT